MRKLLFVAIIGLAVAACGKKDDVKPDAASNVAGVYTLSYIRFDTAAVPYFGPFTLPYVVNGVTAISGTMTASRVAADSVKLDVHVAIPSNTTQPNVDYTYGTFNVKSSGSTYLLSAYGIQAGTIDGKTLNFDLSYPDYDNPKITDRDVFVGAK